MRLTLLFLGLFLSVNTIGQLPTFGPPLNIPIYLSGNFGELRPNHFHAGLDMKSPIGSHVLAAETGWVSRIKVGLYGYGKVLYVDHPNGYTTVYAHLNSFNDEIGEFVRQAQYREERYDIQVYPGKGILPVERGAVIAYSGNTGGSAGPHLHFEIRETTSEVPRNPQLFGLAVKDEIKPVIQAVSLYPLGPDSEIKGSDSPVRYSVFPSGGSYRLNAHSKITVQGPLGIGISTTDRANGASNQNGTYRVRLLVDSVEQFGFTMDSIPFDQSRALNAHIDYPYYVGHRQRYQRLFLLENNPLSIYETQVPYLDLEEGHHDLTIMCEDVQGNTSEVTFGVEVKEKPETSLLEAVETINPRIPYYYESEKVFVEIPANTLYETTAADFEVLDGRTGFPIVKILDGSIPFHRPVKIELAPDTHLTNPEKWMVAQVTRDGSFHRPLATTFANGTYTAESKYAGYFTLVADSAPPEITSVNFVNNKTFRAGEIRFKTNDRLSGILDFDAYVNGKWVLMGYEPKEDLLFLSLSELQKSSDARELKLIVKDGLGNAATFEGVFYYN